MPTIRTALALSPSTTTDHLEDLNILSMALDIPIIIGAAGATKILKSGTSITMDASNGMVYAGHNKIEFE